MGPPASTIRLAALSAALLGFGCSESTEAPTPGRAATEGRVRRVDPPAADGSIALSPVEAEGAVIATWIEPHGGAHRVRFARLRGTRWSAPSTVTESEQLLVNWADFPMPLRIASGAYFVTFPVRGTERYASWIQLARSRDGAAWDVLGTLHEDTTQTEHGFVSLIAEGGGARAVWLDGRAMIDDGPMSVRAASIAADGAISDRSVIDARACDCCQTTAIATPDGALVAYRDRSENEVRDISIARRAAGGWTEPLRVHADDWTMPGCPVNGPRAASDGRRAVLAWYTEAGGARVSVAFSEDAGARWAQPIEIDAARPLGRVDVEWTEQGDALVSWLAASEREGEAIVRLRRVAPDRRIGATFDVARTGAARASGFPRMARLGARMLVSWTDVGPPTRVRAAIVDPSDVAAPDSIDRARRPPRPEPLAIGAALPDLEAVDLEGTAVSLASLRGAPIVISFFATWCEPCREEYPLLSRIAREHGDRVRVVGVSLDDGALADVAEHARANDIAYTVLHDRDDAATRAFGVPPIPATFVFDAQGTLRFRRVGGGPELLRELPEAVLAVLRDRPGP